MVFLFKKIVFIKFKGDITMNFIDEALKSNLHGDDFLQAMADIYKEPDVSDILDRYPKFIKDVIFRCIHSRRYYKPPKHRDS